MKPEKDQDQRNLDNFLGNKSNWTTPEQRPSLSSRFANLRKRGFSFLMRSRYLRYQYDIYRNEYRFQLRKHRRSIPFILFCGVSLYMTYKMEKHIESLRREVQVVKTLTGQKIESEDDYIKSIMNSEKYVNKDFSDTQPVVIATSRRYKFELDPEVETLYGEDYDPEDDY